MIIFFEFGRLGNQLFQYAGLKEFFPNERIVFFGCEDLEEVLPYLDHAITLPKAKFPRGFIVSFSLFLTYLSSNRILGRVREVSTENTYKIEKKRGLIFNIYLAKNCFFQHKDVIDNLSIELCLSENITTQAKAWLCSQEKYQDSSDLVFVHIRRGDYVNWPQSSYPAVLNFSWYERMTEKVRERLGNPLFLILTDDIFYSQDLFGERKDVLISNNSLYVDLALMSLCEHGILSASSFSWWGAWFSRHSNPIQNSLGADRFYIAPQFWAGHRQGKWYPPYFMSSWIEYYS